MPFIPRLILCLSLLLSIAGRCQETVRFRQWIGGEETGGMEVRAVVDGPRRRIESREWIRLERLGLAVEQEVRQTLWRGFRGSHPGPVAAPAGPGTHGGGGGLVSQTSQAAGPETQGHALPRPPHPRKHHSLAGGSGCPHDGRRREKKFFVPAWLRYPHATNLSPGTGVPGA